MRKLFLGSQGRSRNLFPTKASDRVLLSVPWLLFIVFRTSFIQCGFKLQAGRPVLLELFVILERRSKLYILVFVFSFSFHDFKKEKKIHNITEDHLMT